MFTKPPEPLFFRCTFHVGPLHIHFLASCHLCPAFSLPVEYLKSRKAMEELPLKTKPGWLVVSSPLKNMSSSVGITIPNIWKQKSHVPNHIKPPTRSSYFFHCLGSPPNELPLTSLTMEKLPLKKTSHSRHGKALQGRSGPDMLWTSQRRPRSAGD